MRYLLSKDKVVGGGGAGEEKKSGRKEQKRKKNENVCMYVRKMRGQTWLGGEEKGTIK